jgi:type I restriction enzyme, S subunit
LSRWPVRNLGKIADEGGGEIRTGPFGSQLHRHEYTDGAGGVPVVMPLNMIGGRIDVAGIAKITPAKAVEMSVHVTHAGDVLLSRRGDIGRYCLVDAENAGALCGTGSLRISIQGSSLMPEYLCCYLETTRGLHELQSRAVGSTMPNINTAIVRSLEMPVPPLPVQRKIVAFLSAYDDLIENNNCRIRILEEMARRIYQEWFVEFRYPGHEDMPLVESDLGPIPRDWYVTILSDLVNTQYGYTASTATDPVGPRFLRGMDINKASYIDWSRVPYCRIDKADYEKFRLAVGDVLIIRMADPGKVGLVEQRDIDAVFASYLVRLRSRITGHLDPYFLFYYLSNEPYQGFVTGASTGTTRKSLSAKVMVGASLAVPPTALQQLFAQQVGPLRGLLGDLLASNANLRAARDLLLPRLISGEIDVEALDTATEDLAA